MGKWTRRDLVKAGLAASAGIVTRGEALSQVSGITTHKVGQPTQAAASRGANPDNLRDRLSMDYGWRFALGHANDPDKDFGFGKLRREGTFAKSGRVDGPAAIRFDDSAWKQVDLPHDWAVDMQFVNDPILVEHGGKPLGREYPETSIGWYRKQFVLPGSDTGRNISVEFDGIFRNATVFFNGHYITQNMSGYAPVAVDLTDFCNFADAASMQRVERQKQELTNATTDQARARIQSAMEVPGQNVLVVRVDATLDEGWFYEGAGIYRHVWLTKSSPVHIAQWGNYVRPDFGAVAGVASGTSMAALLISTEVTNTGNDDAIARVRATILDPTGKTVATAASEPAGIDSRETRVFKLNTTLNKPKLWSLDTPNLYRAIMHVEVDGKPVDEEVTTFGVRTVKFDANRGLLLNGQPVKIKGTCNHQDHAGVGAAIPDRIQEYRVERLQWMGSNGCRTSHNPPTPEFLDACDRKGMLVMDETRMMSSNPEGLSQLERLIKRDRNHPSVIIWSLANEEPEQGNTRGARIVNTMKRLQRKLDPSRVCTTAMNNGYGGDGVSTVVDVQGFNYNDGRIDAYHRDHPLQPMVGTETASSLSTRGIFANDKTRGYMSAYDTEKPAWGNTAEEWWSFYADREWLAGGFAWTGFDYRGETTPYKWPCISSHFGILDTCGFPKDTAFYYKTWWGSEPALHLLPHWNWEGKEGQEIEVWAYSNQDSVELFLNGTSLGSQPAKKNSHLVWKVKYAPGVLEARASKAGRVVLTDKRETAGPAAKIVATADRTRIAADGRDVAVINVSIMDAQGHPLPTADNKLSFAVSGPATVIGVGNGDPSCHEPDHATERSAFNGLCMAIIQTRRGATGSISIAITSPGLQPATVMVDSVSAPLPPIV
jgi:beta-galactosidase